MRQSIFIGKLTHAPELKTNAAGTPILEIELMVRERKGESWEDHRFQMTVWGDAAKRVAKQGKHGSEIVAFCKPQAYEYTTKSGGKRWSEDHVATWVRVCMPEEPGEADAQPQA